MQPYQNVIPAKHLVNLSHYYWKQDIFAGHRGTLILELKKKEGSCIKCHQTKGLINGKSCSLLTISQSVNTSGVLEPPAAFLYLSPTSQACLFNMQVGGRFRTRWLRRHEKQGVGRAVVWKAWLKRHQRIYRLPALRFNREEFRFPLLGTLKRLVSAQEVIYGIVQTESPFWWGQSKLKCFVWQLLIGNVVVSCKVCVCKDSHYSI